MSAHVSASARAEARRALADGLAAMKAPTPCQGPDRDAWTADAPEVLAEAAERCAPCPVREACRAAGRGESWGAWGGRVRAWRGMPGKSPAPRPAPPPGPSAGRAQLALLALGTRPGPVTPAELRADLEDLGLALPNQGLAHVIRTAAAAGHVDRRTNAKGRTATVSITDAGRAEAERLAAEVWP